MPFFFFLLLTNYKNWKPGVDIFWKMVINKKYWCVKYCREVKYTWLKHSSNIEKYYFEKLAKKRSEEKMTLNKRTNPLSSPECSAWHLLFNQISRWCGRGRSSHIFTNFVCVLRERRQAILLSNFILLFL